MVLPDVRGNAVRRASRSAATCSRGSARGATLTKHKRPQVSPLSSSAHNPGGEATSIILERTADRLSIRTPQASTPATKRRERKRHTRDGQEREREREITSAFATSGRSAATTPLSLSFSQHRSLLLSCWLCLRDISLCGRVESTLKSTRHTRVHTHTSKCHGLVRPRDQENRLPCLPDRPPPPHRLSVHSLRLRTRSQALIRSS